MRRLGRLSQQWLDLIGAVQYEKCDRRDPRDHADLDWVLERMEKIEKEVP